MGLNGWRRLGCSKQSIGRLLVFGRNEGGVGTIGSKVAHDQLPTIRGVDRYKDCVRVRLYQTV